MGEAADVMRSKIAVFNAQDAGELMRLCSPEVEWEAPGTLLQGPDQVVAHFSAYWEAFPDLELTVASVVEEGPVAAIRGRVAGTHLGTFRTPGGDIPPTGRRADLTFGEEFEVQGGVIVSAHLHFDRLELLVQLGLAPAPAAA
jgi:predicted ester cyclase